MGRFLFWMQRHWWIVLLIVLAVVALVLGLGFGGFGWAGEQISKPAATAAPKIMETLVPTAAAPPTYTPLPTYTPAPIPTPTVGIDTALIAQIPGATLGRATLARAPTMWVPDNAQAEYRTAVDVPTDSGYQGCLWSQPAGTPLRRDGEGYKLTNCVSFNLDPEATLSVTWTYGSWPYFAGEWNGRMLNTTLTHDVYTFLRWNWDYPDGQPLHDGIAWWGPEKGSTARVSYDGGKTWVKECRSFEVIPNVEIQVEFTNTGTTSAVWSQGAWSAYMNWVYPPECRAPYPTTK